MVIDNVTVITFFLIAFFVFGIIEFTSYFRIDNNRDLIKFRFFIRTKVISIEEITSIDVVTIEDAGIITINLKKGTNTKDEFIIHTQDGKKYKFSAYYLNHECMDLWEFLVTQYHIKSKEIQKVRYRPF